MARTTVEGIGGAQSLVGQHLGDSDWVEITQEQVDRFAEATGDRYWLHLDAERAGQGRFGTTIAHGFLTLSLFTALLAEVVEVNGAATTVNYGLDRVRFPAPVPTGSRVRLGVELAHVKAVEGGVQATWSATFQIEGATKPACVAEVLFRYYA